MANVSRIRGFVPAKSLIGAPWQSLVRQYNADASKTNPIFIGDAVTLDTDGNVIQAVSGGVILGVVVAVGETTTTFGETGYFNPNDLGQRFLAAADAGIVGIVPAEAAMFNVFDNGVDLDLNQGAFADLIIPATTATQLVTGNSIMALVAAVNNDVKVVERNTAPDNDDAELDAQYIVKFVSTEHTF